MKIDTNKTLLIYGAPLYPVAKKLLESLSTDIIPNWSFDVDHFSTFNEETLNQFETIILLVPSSSLEKSDFFNKISFIGDFYLRHPYKLIISFFTNEGWSDSLYQKLPFFEHIIFNNNPSLNNTDELTTRIQASFDKHTLESQNNYKRIVELKKTIEDSSSQHLEPIRKDLKERATSLEKSAQNWFVAGFIFLIAALIAPFIILFFTNSLSSEDYPSLILYTIKSVVFVLLAISLSKYASNLGRSYMNESQKISDRKHAISFGEFALKVSKDPIKYQELNELFKEWNINGNSSFMPGTVEDHDPKLLEKVKDIILAIKGKG